MAAKEIKIGKHSAFLKRWQVVDVEFQKDGRSCAYVTPEKERITKTVLVNEKIEEWRKEDGTKYDGETWKLTTDDRAFPGFTATKEVKEEKITEVDVAERLADAIEVTATYGVTSDTLKDELKEKPGKGITFKFVMAKGAVRHDAVIFYDKKDDILKMKCCRGRESQVSKEEVKGNKKDIKIKTVDADSW